MSVVDDIKLDNRIVGGLQSVITAKDVLSSRAADRLSLVGVAGYAADNIAYFSGLDDKPVMECVEVRPGLVYPFYCAPVDALDRVLPYQFFIRESRVLIFREQEEPKARPFTIVEFEKHFNIGDKLYLRVDKSPRCLVGQVLAYRCIAGDDESLEVLISGLSLCLKSAQWLFEHVEWSPAGDLVDWRPFGVEGV